MKSNFIDISKQPGKNKWLNNTAAITFFFLLFTFAFFISAEAQTPETPNTEQQLENSTEGNDDEETEDDSYLQQMQRFIKTPISLNTASEDDLKELKFLTPVQINNFFIYRNLFGEFIDIYEIQAIPGWNIELIEKIIPFITIGNNQNAITTLNNQLSGGEQNLLVRFSQIIEKAKGYAQNAATNFYPGSPQKLLLRYKYQFKNLLQYGFVAEKDAGEQFFKGRQKQGFDFYSAHLFARNMGIIKSLALGDFTVNLGQGLTQWQSLAFKKSADVINIKREAETLRPYNSAGEIYFHRGAGITLKKNNMQATVFASYKKIDANFVTDTLASTEDYISSLQTSGYHRTKSEMDDKGIQRQFAFGGNISYQYKNFHFGINGVQYKFKWPLHKSADPYNQFALSGASFGNYSADYSYTYKNLHFFGEAASTNNSNLAFINGLLISTYTAVDMSFLYRNISAGYQSLYTNAFTENTLPMNEKGFYAGIAIHPDGAWRVDGYADIFKFPWLKYRVDAPGTGSEYLLQVTYKPNKQLEIYSRFRTQSKGINFNPNGFTLSPIIAQPKKNWRTQFSYKLNSVFTFRNRVEAVWFNEGADKQELGFLMYTDVLYKPMLKPWSGNFRLQYFETDSYNSRIYAYENDVLYSFSIPAFYDKGVRYYANINYDVNRKLSFWFKWAQIIYQNKHIIGSGLDEINSNKKSEIKLQLLYKF
jgi:hypothetical protein